MKNRMNRCCCTEGCEIVRDDFNYPQDEFSAVSLNNAPTSGWQVTGTLQKQLGVVHGIGTAILNSRHPRSGPLEWPSSGRLEAEATFLNSPASQTISLLIEPDKENPTDQGYAFAIAPTDPTNVRAPWYVIAGNDFTEVFSNESTGSTFRLCIDYYSGEHEDGPHKTSIQASIQSVITNSVLWSKSWTSTGISRNHGVVGFSLSTADERFGGYNYRRFNEFHFYKSGREDPLCPTCWTRPLITSVNTLRGGFASWQSLANCTPSGYSFEDPIRIIGAGSLLETLMNRWKPCDPGFAPDHESETGWVFSIHGALSEELPDQVYQQFLVPFVANPKVPPNPAYDGTIFDVYGYAYRHEDGSYITDPFTGQRNWKPYDDVVRVPRSELLGSFTVAIDFQYGVPGQSPNLANIVNLVRGNSNFVKARGMAIIFKPRETYQYLETGGSVLNPFPNRPQGWLIRTPTPAREVWRVLYS